MESSPDATGNNARGAGYRVDRAHDPTAELVMSWE